MLEIIDNDNYFAFAFARRVLLRYDSVALLPIASYLIVSLIWRQLIVSGKLYQQLQLNSKCRADHTQVDWWLVWLLVLATGAITSDLLCNRIHFKSTCCTIKRGWWASKSMVAL